MLGLSPRTVFGRARDGFARLSASRVLIVGFGLCLIGVGAEQLMLGGAMGNAYLFTGLGGAMLGLGVTGEPR